MIDLVKGQVYFVDCGIVMVAIVALPKKSSILYP